MSYISANLFPPRPELCIKVESVSVFLDITKVADVGKMLMSAELKGHVA